MPLFVIGKLEEINLLLIRNNVILVNNNVQMIVCLSVGCDGKSFTLLLIIVTSRVQLGIVLRPLPFLPHVNDLRKHLESSLRLFADDVLLYVVISFEKDSDGKEKGKWYSIPANARPLVFLLRKNLNKGETFSVGWNWNRLNIFPISVVLLNSVELVRTRNIRFQESRYQEPFELHTQPQFVRSLNTPMLLGTHITKRTLFYLRGSREQLHGFTPATTTTAAANVTDRLSVLYMSRGQVDIDLIHICNPILKLGIERVIAIERGKIRRRRTFTFIPFLLGQDKVNYGTGLYPRK